MKSLVAHFGLFFTIYKKYDSLLSKFGFEDKDNEDKKIGWLLYIAVKNEIYGTKKNIIELACLLMPLLDMMVSENSKMFMKLDDGISIRKQLIEIFQIKSEASIEPIFITFQSIALQILKPLGFIESVKDFNKIWDTTKFKKVIEVLVNRCKNSPVSDIDETVFARESVEFSSSEFELPNVINVHITPISLNPNILISPLKTPSKLSPYKSGAIFNKKLKDSIYGYNIPCRTVFNELELTDSNIKVKSWLDDCLNKPQIENSLISVYLEKKIENLPNVRKIVVTLIESTIQEVLKNHDKNEKSIGSEFGDVNISTQIRQLYLYLIEELLTIEDKRNGKAGTDNVLMNEEFHRGIFVTSCEIILFVHNIDTIKFAKILKDVMISAFGVWKIVPSLLRLDLPFIIIHYFQTLEKKIISEMAWEKNSPISDLFIHFFKKSDAKQVTSPQLLTPINQRELSFVEEMFGRKTLQFTASVIVTVTNQMKILDERIKENIWDVMKQCLAFNSELLLDRNIVNLILCSIYGVCRVEKMEKESNPEYTFNNIIKCYIF